MAEKEAEIAKLKTELNERSAAADSQRINMVALQIRNDALTDQVADFSKKQPISAAS